MKIIQMQAILNVVMGVLDDEGDVVQQVPLQVPLAKLDEPTLQRALAEIKAKRQELEKQVLTQDAPQAVEPEKIIE